VRVPAFDRIWLQGLGLFLLGTVTGAVALMIVHQANYSVLATENTRLAGENRRLTEELEDMKNQASRHSVIASVLAHVETRDGSPLGELVRTELKRQIENELKVYRGKPVQLLTDPRYFDFEIVRRLLSKPFRVGQGEYAVELRAVFLVRSDLHVWVRAAPSSPP